MLGQTKADCMCSRKLNDLKLVTGNPHHSENIFQIILDLKLMVMSAQVEKSLKESLNDLMVVNDALPWVDPEK